MYCRNCGNKLEAGDLFCPECGTRQSAAQTPKQDLNVQASRVQPAPAGITIEQSEKKKLGIRLSLVITSILMFLSTFLPFVNFSFGETIEKIAGFAGDYIWDILPEEIVNYIGTFKYNFYGLIEFGMTRLPEYKLLLIAVLVLVIITMVLALVSVFINKRVMYVAVGILSAICFIFAVVCVVITGRFMDELNNEIHSYFGELGDLISGALEIKTADTAGLTLFLIISVAQAVFAFLSAVGKKG